MLDQRRNCLHIHRSHPACFLPTAFSFQQFSCSNKQLTREHLVGVYARWEPIHRIFPTLEFYCPSSPSKNIFSSIYKCNGVLETREKTTNNFVQTSPNSHVNSRFYIEWCEICRTLVSLNPTQVFVPLLYSAHPVEPRQ